LAGLSPAGMAASLAARSFSTETAKADVCTCPLRPETGRRRDALAQTGHTAVDCPPRFVPSQQLGRVSPAGLVLEIEVAERLSVLVAYDEAGVIVPASVTLAAN
jgi:hypothetical protein